jgi:hypothetical protein
MLGDVDLSSRLRAHWARQVGRTFQYVGHPPRLRPGVRESRLQEFEAKHDVQLSDDMRLYFREVDGMDDWDTDDDLISFWNLDRVDEREESSDRPGLFAFADWSIKAQIWLIDLSRGRGQDVVFVTGAVSLVPIADSFTAFVEKYLSDRMLIWPP